MLAPGQDVEAHVHHKEDDAFLVLEGTLSLTLGDDAQPLEAGPWTYVLVPAGTGTRSPTPATRTSGC